LNSLAYFPPETGTSPANRLTKQCVHPGCAEEMHEENRSHH
jgi:hypothetical protein